MKKRGVSGYDKTGTTRLRQNNVVITFCTDLVDLNFMVRGKPLWRHSCIEQRVI